MEHSLLIQSVIIPRIFLLFKLKNMLISTPIMQPLDSTLPFELICDASDYVVGVVLGQRKDKKPHVIYIAIKTLNDTQINYSTTKKELLAVVFVFKKFVTSYKSSKYHLESWES